MSPRQLLPHSYVEFKISQLHVLCPLGFPFLLIQSLHNWYII